MFRRRTSLRTLINIRFNELKEIIMATQADVDALTTAVADLSTALAGDVTNINAEISALEQQIANGQPVDLTALQAAVASLSSTVDTAGQIAPTTPPAS